MPTNARKTVNVSLGEILEGLLEAGVDFVLVGGLAAVFQGAPVTTMDVDVVHSRSHENAAKLLRWISDGDGNGGTVLEQGATSSVRKAKKKRDNHEVEASFP